MTWPAWLWGHDRGATRGRLAVIAARSPDQLKEKRGELEGGGEFKWGCSSANGLVLGFAF